MSDGEDLPENISIASKSSTDNSAAHFDLAAEDDEEQPVEASEHPSEFQDAGSRDADSSKATASADKSIPENALRYARSKQYINFILDDLRLVIFFVFRKDARNCPTMSQKHVLFFVIF